MRPDDERYFARIEDRLDEAPGLAETAEGQGDGPGAGSGIPVARDMADRGRKIRGPAGAGDAPGSDSGGGSWG